MLLRACLRLLPILRPAYHPFTRLIPVTKLGKTSIHCNMEMLYSRSRRVLSNVLEVTRLLRNDIFTTEMVISSSKDNVDGLGSIPKVWQG